MTSRALVRVWRAVASKFSREDAIEFVQNLAQEYAFNTFKPYLHDLGKPPQPMSRESLISAHTPPDLDAIVAAAKKRTPSFAHIVEPAVIRGTQKLKDAAAAQRVKESSSEEQDKNKNNKSDVAVAKQDPLVNPALMNGGDEGGERRQGSRGMEHGR